MCSGTLKNILIFSLANLCINNIFFQSIETFGQTVEALLVKHGKNIIDEQFVLNRLADCAIDIYAMSCILSRCTRSIKLNLPSVEHERAMTETWCIEAAERCLNNNKKITTPYNKIYPKYSQISKTICGAQGVANSNPLNI